MVDKSEIMNENILEVIDKLTLVSIIQYNSDQINNKFRKNLFIQGLEKEEIEQFPKSLTSLINTSLKIKKNDNHRKESTSLENLSAKNSISLEGNINSNGNTQCTNLINTQESNKNLSNNNLYESLMNSSNENTFNNDSNEENTKTKFEIKTESLTKFIAANLVDTLIINQENIFRYDLESLFYKKYFENFSSNHLISSLNIKNTNNTVEAENKEIDTEQLTNVLFKHINKIIKKLESEISTNIIAMIYLKRIINDENLYLSLETVLYVFIMLVCLAYKYNEDIIFTNKDLAKILNLHIFSFNEMELMLCHLLNYRLHVLPDEFMEVEFFISQNIVN